MVALVDWGAKSRAAPVSGANPHHGIHCTDVDLAVSGFALTSCISDGLGHIFQTLIVNDDFDLELFQELEGEC